MINKPIEGGNRKPSRLRFFLRLVLTAAVVSYCIFLNIQRCTVTAHAAGFDTLTLTPEQTIGLYGDSLEVIYTGNDNIDQYFQAHIAGAFPYLPGYPTTSADPRLWSNNDWGPFNGLCNILWYYPQDPVTAFDYSLKHKEYVVYFIAFNKGTFHSHSSIAHPNIRININYNIPIDCKYMESWLMFGRDPAARDSGWTYIQHNTNPSSGYSHMMPSGSVGNGLVAYTPYPDYYPATTDEGQGCNPMGVIAASFGNKFGDTLYRCTGESWTLNGCAIAPYMSTAIADYFLIYVSCPVLYMDYNPPIPETTEPVPATTRPDFTTYNYTYDLSPLETNQINQINIQNQQLQIDMAQLDTLNYIAKKLDQIYNDMIKDGKIPVDLIPGHDFAIPTDIKNFVGNQLTTYTMASMNFNTIYRPFTSFMDLFDSYNWLDEFAILGGFSLAFGVFCWFVFRGRGGGA